MNLEEMYKDFLEKGELQALMPTSTGDWEKDKAEFKETYIMLYESFIEDEEEDEDNE